jgi:hypothetical protein
MPTLSPSTEACEAIRDRINSGTDYTLEVRAEVRDEITEDLKDLRQLRVDVCQESEEQLFETIDLQDNTSHVIRVWIRKKLDTTTQDELEQLKLLKRQIELRLLNYATADWRVRVWEVSNAQAPVAERDMLHQDRSFVTGILLRVEVKP